MRKPKMEQNEYYFVYPATAIKLMRKNPNSVQPVKCTKTTA